MFVEINGANYNMYSISSFKSKDELVENSNNTQTIKYLILYESVSGLVLREEFNSSEDRDAKYQTLLNDFLAK